MSDPIRLPVGDFNLPPGVSVRDLDGGSSPCETCGSVGPVDEDGLCEECADVKLGREMLAELGAKIREAMQPKPDFTIYYPSRWGIFRCGLATEDGGWPLVITLTTAWKRWMPVLHPGEQTQWSLEVIFP